jgi:uncharacterized protein YecE (DUF72 family)
MKFGKTENLDGIDFKLPPDHQHNTFENKEEFACYFGAPVWGDTSFIGKIYPKGTKPSDFLNHYSRHFNAIELNSSFYKIPSAQQVEKWLASCPADFRFCPKVPQIFAQRTDLGIKHPLLPNFFESLLLMGKQLGMVFLQLPPGFAPSKAVYLHDFCQSWPKDVPLAIEFRHPEWFINPNFESISKDLESQGINMVITDTAGRRDVLHSRITGNKAFIRFTGNQLHPSDFERIQAWAERILEWKAKGISDVYFFIHQPVEGLCVEIAIHLINYLNKAGLKLRAPQVLASGSQGELF